ncbi:uncharacterized protein LOC135145728 isoform X2 [Zophobas morio]|uniref:uncharacterized protein LOC135145728 isoform X2 n=1 Tax=Zophobas morio TaxID=2755281 RepID=UPI0030829ABF
MSREESNCRELCSSFASEAYFSFLNGYEAEVCKGSIMEFCYSSSSKKYASVNSILNEMKLLFKKINENSHQLQNITNALLVKGKRTVGLVDIGEIVTASQQLMAALRSELTLKHTVVEEMLEGSFKQHSAPLLYLNCITDEPYLNQPYLLVSLKILNVAGGNTED